MITYESSFSVRGLLVTVFASIFEVFILCLAGYVLAWKGMLDKKTQKNLNKINVALFTPSLLFSKVAFFLSPDKLRELWVIPIFFIIATVASMLVAWLFAFALRLSRSQRSFAIAASMFMNSNSLPVALMQSLVITVPGLRWGPDDNKDVMIGRALTYLVLYSTFGMILRWSYGVRLLAQADDPKDSPIRLPEDGDEDGERHLRDLEETLPSDSTPGIVVDDSSSTSTDSSPSNSAPLDKDATLHSRPAPHHKSSYFYRSFPNSPNQSERSLRDGEGTVVGESEEEDGARNAEIFTRQPAKLGQSPKSQILDERPTTLRKYLLRPLATFWNGFTDFMTVPLYAAFLSIIVALVPALQHSLEVHLYPVKGALESAGACSIPVTLVVLGAYFYKENNVSAEGPDVVPTRMEHIEQAGQVLPTATEQSSSSSVVQHVRTMFTQIGRKGKRRARLESEHIATYPGETKTVIVSVLSRMVLAPLVLMPLLVFAAKDDWHRVFEDPVFVVSNVLLVSSPPALTLAQITQAASGDAFERLISRTIFWSYCIVTPPLTIVYVMIGLILTRI